MPSLITRPTFAQAASTIPQMPWSQFGLPQTSMPQPTNPLTTDMDETNLLMAPASPPTINPFSQRELDHLGGGFENSGDPFGQTGIFAGAPSSFGDFTNFNVGPWTGPGSWPSWLQNQMFGTLQVPARSSPVIGYHGPMPTL